MTHLIRISIWQWRWLIYLNAIFLYSSVPLFANEQAAEDRFQKTTYVYKSVGPTKIRADVYRRQTEAARPVIVWLHGGALIMGSRTGVPKQLLDLAKREGFVLVSLGYRLAPEAKLDDIIEDLADGLRWVRERGPMLFNAQPKRMVVAGASAGGYLALMSANAITPPPTAIVSYWGFGDVTGDWTTRPSAAYLKGKLISKEQAWAGVGGPVITSPTKDNGRGRSSFFLYLKQTGRWIHAVSGLDPIKDREQLKRFNPIQNVSPKFPPTLFLHGTADKDVPVEQSLSMARELRRHRVDCELITIQGGGHSLWGGDPKLIEKAFERSVEYIRERLNGGEPSDTTREQ